MSGDAAELPVATTVVADAARDGLDAAFRAHYVPLLRLATALVDRDTAEEIVQDAFVRGYGKLHRVAPDRVAAYLRSAVINGSRSQLRRREVSRRHAPAPPRAVEPAEAGGVAGAERAAMLRRLDALPPRQREVLILRYYLDLSEQDIAAAMGISLGSVKTHAHRGLATLAGRLEATA